MNPIRLLIGAEKIAPRPLQCKAGSIRQRVHDLHEKEAIKIRVPRHDAANAVLDQSAVDSDATLTGLPTGQTVQLHVITVNQARNSPASSTEEIVMP